MAETAGAKSVEKIAQEISAGDLQEAKNIIKSNQLWEEILNNVIKKAETTLWKFNILTPKIIYRLKMCGVKCIVQRLNI